MTQPKFQPNTAYTKAEIEQLTGYRPVDVLKHLPGHHIAVNDMIGEYTQYDFVETADGLYLLTAVDGEKVTPKTPMRIFTEAAANPVRLPAFYLEVFANGTFYVVGKPNESHNCDRMGCTSLEHTIARGVLVDWQVEDVLGLPDGFLSGNDEKVQP